MSFDAPLFINSGLPFAQVAETIHRVAFPDFDCEERDGLNVGGGNYFRFRRDRDQVILVCNDLAHGEVFVPERSEYPFYCYSNDDGDAVLQSAKTALLRADISCDILAID